MSKKRKTSVPASAGADGAQIKAVELHNLACQGIFISAMAIKEIFDNNYFRELGFETVDEYCEQMLPIKRRTAYEYYTVANKFGSLLGMSLKDNTLALNPSSDALEFVRSSAHEEDKEVARFVNLGLKKLLILTRLTEEKIIELIDNGETWVYDNRVTMEMVENGTVKEVAKLLKEPEKEKAETEDGEDAFVNKLLQNMRLLRLKIESYKGSDKKVRQLQERYDAFMDEVDALLAG